jgi:membrane protease YdiL (CAAX protease family)
MIATYGLLGMAILSVWLPGVPLGRTIRVPVWSLLLVAAIACGLAMGFLGTLALLPTGVLAALCCVAARLEHQPDRTPWLRRLVLLAVGVLSLALAMHLVPGFRNPRVINEVVLSPGAPPFSQYLNFDKGVVGLLLLAFLSRRAHSWGELRAGLRATALGSLRTIAVVMACAVLVGYVAVDLKLPEVTPIFMLANLLFTCVAEEAFFRGLLQARLAACLQHRRGGAAIAVAVVGLLFGAAHLAGGWKAGLLASMAGIGYGVAYHRSQKIEAAILLHFALNAVQFLAFTYPFLVKR